MQVLQEIEGYLSRGIHRGLGAMQKAADVLGHPETSYPTVHIAGTNGKGSTALYLASILHQAGYKVGLTLSPHVEDYCERIQINGKKISLPALQNVHDKLKAKLTGGDFSYFEWTILLAMEFFAEQKVDIGIFEVGLGGRWDATNIIKPLAGAITSIAKDHQEILGDTLDKILEEKIQIIKAGMQLWSGVTQPELIQRIKQACRERGGSFFSVEADTPRERNKALAVGLAQSLREGGFVVTPTQLRQGLAQTLLPGRLEWFENILLDVAHNPAGIEALARYLSDHEIRPHLLFGCLADKPAGEMLALLKDRVASITLARFEAERAMTEEALKKLPWPSLTLSRAGFAAYREKISRYQPILVTGSFYLVSELRKYINR